MSGALFREKFYLDAKIVQ